MRVSIHRDGDEQQTVVNHVTETALNVDANEIHVYYIDGHKDTFDLSDVKQVTQVDPGA